MKTCENCRGKGNKFIKNDYADRALKSTHHHKGNVGHWKQCKSCYGTGKVYSE